MWFLVCVLAFGTYKVSISMDYRFGLFIFGRRLVVWAFKLALLVVRVLKPVCLVSGPLERSIFCVDRNMFPIFGNIYIYILWFLE